MHRRTDGMDRRTAPNYSPWTLSGDNIIDVFISQETILKLFINEKVNDL